MDLFSTQSLMSWQSRLNSSSRFAEAAGAWEGRLLLVETGTGMNRRAWVVVRDGKCVEARVGTEADVDSADYVLAASGDTWADLVAARHTPAMAALSGRLSLQKGSVLSLIPHARAAAELLAAAADGSV